MSENLPLERYDSMSLAELTTPTEGRRVYRNRWWAVTDNDEALFYRGNSNRIGQFRSPQCNHDKRVVEGHIMPKGTRAVFIPVAYVPHRCD